MAIDSTQPDVQARLRDLLTSRQINGDYWLQQGDWEMAIQAYQETLEFQPDYSWSYYGLGYALQQQQWWSEAAAAYRQALQLNPDFSISYSNLGDCLFRQGQVENAIHAYHQALSINPDVPDTQMRLGDAYLFQGRTDAAIVCYQAAIQLDPQSLPVYLKLRQLKTYGLVRFKPEQIQSLINSYQQVIQQHPDHVECYVNLGDILTEAGQIDPAIKAYTQGTYQKLAQCRPQWIQGWDDHVTPQPGFLIIGAQKAGSTSLYQYLCHHPQV
ncbi:MAG: tetratricopeptide repeat protein [Microcoleaceae cyanobacterium]